MNCLGNYGHQLYCMTVCHDTVANIDIMERPDIMGVCV